jgi:hypothetical protein
MDPATPAIFHPQFAMLVRPLPPGGRPQGLHHSFIRHFLAQACHGPAKD